MKQEEEKREQKEKMITQPAICPFCGQIQIREAGIIGMSEEGLEEFAKLHCRCQGAQIYRSKKRKREEARKQIAEWFKEEKKKDFREIAMKITGLVQEGKMESAILINEDGKKLKIGISGAGRLKISIRKTTAEEKIIS